LTVRKIVKTVAIRCHILKQKCTKSDFSWGSTADPSALLDLRGLSSKGREEKERRRREGEKRGEGKGGIPPLFRI